MTIPVHFREIAHAWVDGAKIQTRYQKAVHECDRGWRDCEAPVWTSSIEYRIKPSTIEMWQWAFGEVGFTGVTFFHYATEEEARKYFSRSVDWMVKLEPTKIIKEIQ